MIYLDYLKGFLPGIRGDRYAVPEKAKVRLKGKIFLDSLKGFIPGKGDKLSLPIDTDSIPAMMEDEEVLVLENAYNIKTGTSRQLGTHRTCMSFPIEKTCLPSSVRSKDKRKICTYCYGKSQDSGEYGINSKASIASREANFDYYKKGAIDFFAELNLILSRKKEGKRYFRYFVVGDIPDSLFLELAINLALQRKEFHFWMPTLKADLVEDIIKENIHENLMIRISSPMINDVISIPNRLAKYGVRRSIVFTGDPPKGVFFCPANITKKCGNCNACFHRNVSIIGYQLRLEE